MRQTLVHVKCIRSRYADFSVVCEVYVNCLECEESTDLDMDVGNSVGPWMKDQAQNCETVVSGEGWSLGEVKAWNH